MNIIFSSCGNDSVALIQYCFDKGLKDIHIVYNDTKWGSSIWPDRVKRVKEWSESKGAKFHIIDTIGFEKLCQDQKAFPRNGMAFCSYELKIKPAQLWLEEHDPELEAVCYTGVRREESAKRANWPEWIEESANHGGRSLCSPLVRHTKEMRDELIIKAGFEVLPTRSQECWPCVNASKADIRLLDITDIERIERLEQSIPLGVKSGKPRYMFRATKCGGAQGIRQVIDWANSAHGQYDHDQLQMFGCESGFCGG